MIDLFGLLEGVQLAGAQLCCCFADYNEHSVHLSVSWCSCFFYFWKKLESFITVHHITKGIRDLVALKTLVRTSDRIPYISYTI